MKTIVWFRQDLRTHDNAGLVAAAARGAVVPIFILDEATASEWRLGGASRWWLHHSVTALHDKLGQLALFNAAPRELQPAIANMLKYFMICQV